jgi:hypothetical protein
MEQLLSMLKEKTGVSDEIAEKVVDFIKEHMAEIPQMLMSGGGDAAKNLLGDLAGGSGNAADGAKDAAGGLLDAAKDLFANKE